jgi:hypothetical protein
MTIEEQVIETLRELPPEGQKQVLEFVSRLKAEGRKTPGRSLAGLWADLHLAITENDLTEVRREMWSDFPREMP